MYKFRFFHVLLSAVFYSNGVQIELFQHPRFIISHFVRCPQGCYPSFDCTTDFETKY